MVPGDDHKVTMRRDRLHPPLDDHPRVLIGVPMLENITAMNDDIYAPLVGYLRDAAEDRLLVSKAIVGEVLTSTHLGVG